MIALKKYHGFISYSHERDTLVAEALERDLRRFARRWNRLWAIRIYRDVSNLAVTPDLWGSVKDAILDSEYFILLASPCAARSAWVTQELEAFLAVNHEQQLLIVLTNGQIVWDAARRDFDWTLTTALPECLRARLAHEPKYLDLRWAAAEPVGLQSDRWQDAIADLSSVLQNRPKDELFGQDARERIIQRTLYRSSVVAVIATPLVLIGASIHFSRSAERTAVQRIAVANGVGAVSNRVPRRGGHRSRRLS